MTFTVVAADDDSDIRALVTLVVAKAGLSLVASADNGEAALAAIREHRPDLAILDVSMPTLSGLEVARAVRADDTVAATRILLLTASVDDVSRAAGIAAGADHFLEKPFSPRELSARLIDISREA